MDTDIIPEAGAHTVQPELVEKERPAVTSPQERGRRGAEARWAKARQKTEAVVSEEANAEGDETRTSRSGRPTRSHASKLSKAGEEPHRMSPSERGKKGISHGMSAHDRGVKGAEARWGKVHQETQTKDG